MTNETKTTNEADRRVAELEQELAHVRRQNRMLAFVRVETYRAMWEFMYLPKGANENLCRTRLLDYVKYLGHHYYLPHGWDKVPVPGEDMDLEKAVR
jgi:hypothetical protein